MATTTTESVWRVLLLGAKANVDVPVDLAPDLPRQIVDALARQPSDAALAAPVFVVLGDGKGLINAAAVSACVRVSVAQ